MKHHNKHYMQVSRNIWDYQLSDKAKMLFFWLNELEQRYTSDEVTYFFRTDEELAEDLGWSLKTLKKAKSELKNTDLVRTGKMHWINPNTEKKSERWVTSYTILQ